MIRMAMSPSIPRIADALDQQGFAFVEAPVMRDALSGAGGLDDWDVFAASWDDLHLDRHMADGGRYRRRRHATFRAVAGGETTRQAHQPHYQSLDYNTLNGGIERWFEPVEEAIAQSAALGTILRWSNATFSALSPGVTDWHVEMHQFRIEASPGLAGQPTPEGMHRDGVDHVLVLLVRRENIASGTTSIHDLDGHELGSFTLTRPLDSALVEDRRVFHGVTAVEPVDASKPAFRDVLVLTWRDARELRPR